MGLSTVAGHFLWDAETITKEMLPFVAFSLVFTKKSGGKQHRGASLLQLKRKAPGPLGVSV